jgi:uncharacterized membrane protein
MIDWPAFITVLVASVLSGVVVVTLFSLGLRLVSSERPGSSHASNWRHALGIASFALCALAILYGVYLIIPGLHP